MTFLSDEPFTMCQQGLKRSNLLARFAKPTLNAKLTAISVLNPKPYSAPRISDPMSSNPNPYSEPVSSNPNPHSEPCRSTSSGRSPSRCTSEGWLCSNGPTCETCGRRTSPSLCSATRVANWSVPETCSDKLSNR